MLESFRQSNSKVKTGMESWELLCGGHLRQVRLAAWRCSRRLLEGTRLKTPVQRVSQVSFPSRSKWGMSVCANGLEAIGMFIFTFIHV